MSLLLAIDPGPVQSAFVLMNNGHMVEHAKRPNADLIAWMLSRQDLTVVCEMVSSYGMAVGAEVFETCVWIGEFRHCCRRDGFAWRTITRPEIKLRLCHHTRGVNDSVIRQRLIDMYGGKEKAIGNKKAPGPLYGIKSDAWAALAVAKAWEIQP